MVPPSSRAGGRILAVIVISELWKVRLGWGREAARGLHGESAITAHPEPPVPPPRQPCRGHTATERDRRRVRGFIKARGSAPRGLGVEVVCVWGVGGGGRNRGGRARRHLPKSGPRSPRTTTQGPSPVFRSFSKMVSHIFTERSFKLNRTPPCGRRDRKRLPRPGRPTRTLARSPAPSGEDRDAPAVALRGCASSRRQPPGHACRGGGGCRSPRVPTGRPRHEDGGIRSGRPPGKWQNCDFKPSRPGAEAPHCRLLLFLLPDVKVIPLGATPSQ